MKNNLHFYGKWEIWTMMVKCFRENPLNVAVYSFHKLYIEVENKVVFYFQNVRSILDDLEKIGYEEDFCEFSQQLGFPSRSRFH